MYENVPSVLRERDQWVCVKNGSKAPFQATCRRMASSSDPSTWTSFSTAVKAVERGAYDGIGFVFNGDIVGVDIDKGYDADGMLTAESVDAILTLGSYTEHSRSGRGFHIYTIGKLNISGKNNGEGMEIYDKGRYFIVTGDTFCNTDIVENQSGIDEIVKKYFSNVRSTTGKGNRFRQYTVDWKIPPNNAIPLKPILPPIKSGYRNSSLASYAGTLREYGWSIDDAYAEVTRCNLTACDIPLDESEVEAIMYSIWQYKR